jgi:hypothetical protein
LPESYASDGFAIIPGGQELHPGMMENTRKRWPGAIDCEQALRDQ